MINKYLILIIFITALFIPGKLSAYFFPAVILFLLFLDVSTFRFIFKRQFLFFIFILLLIQPLITGQKDIFMYGINISSTAFYNGLLMILRSLVIISSINYLLKNSDKRKLKNVFTRIGINNFNEIFTYSHKILPLLKEKLKEFSINNRRALFFNPIEFTARFLALLLRNVNGIPHKIKGENFNDK